ncbi:MAG: xyloglucanase [Deltaproteobacteria bacterium]|nr:xyloglucanase [Deltaproteobacteria bacterium]
MTQPIKPTLRVFFADQYRILIFLNILLVTLFSFGACSRNNNSGNSDADNTKDDTAADADSDADSDGDADNDADSDADGDSDADSDSDTDSDSDGDGDGDSDITTDTGVEVDTEVYNNLDVDPNGTYQFKNVRTGAGGGFIVNVIFHPTEPDLIYAKTDMGGVYRWIPETETWKQLLYFVGADDWNWTGAESVALDASDPDKLYIAAGTYTNDWAPTNGVIWRSNDRGNSFEKTNMPFKMGGNMGGRGMGERLAVDPNDGDILYFAGREDYGLWKSDDAGETWSKVDNFPATGTFATNPDDTWDYDNHMPGISWVTFDPATGSAGSATQTIYVGIAHVEPGEPNIFRTTNGGTSWEPLPGQPMSTLEGNTVTMTGGLTWDITEENDDGSLACPYPGLMPKQGKLDADGTLYLTYSNWAGPYRGNKGDVWKFESENEEWTKITPVDGATNPDDTWWGYGGLGVDMQNPGTIVVAGVNSWWPDGVMFRTTDGGETWRPLWEWEAYPEMNQFHEFDLSQAPWLYNPNFNINNEHAAPDQPIKIGWMIEGLNIDPFNPDRMMYGTGMTLFASNNLTNWDNGKHITIESKAYGIEETSVLGLVSPPEGAPLISVVGDVGGWVHYDLDIAPTADERHTIPDDGTMTGIDFAEDDPKIMVRVGKGFASTTDGGATWNKSWGEAPGTNGQVALSADGATAVWAPGDGPVSVSANNGFSAFSPVDGSVPDGASVASDRVDADTFYAFGDGTFFVSNDGGKRFEATVSVDLPISGEIHAVFGHKGHIWLAGGAQVTGGSSESDLNGLWYSTDGGESFTKLENVELCAAVGFGKAAPEGEYPAIFISGVVDGAHEIYRSDDMGQTWLQVTDDTHKFATIQCITGDPRIHGRVYFGTNGFGTLYGDPID